MHKKQNQIIKEISKRTQTNKVSDRQLNLYIPKTYLIFCGHLLEWSSDDNFVGAEILFVLVFLTDLHKMGVKKSALICQEIKLLAPETQDF